MRSRKNQVLLNVLLGTGVYLLDSMRNRLSGASLDDLRAKANDTYDVAADRFSRASDVIRGNDRQLMGPIAAGLLGLGIGVGVGYAACPRKRRADTQQPREPSARLPRPHCFARPATGTFGA